MMTAAAARLQTQQITAPQ